MSGAIVLGMGVVTPLGIGLAPTWSALLSGRGAVAPIRRFDARRYPVTFAAQGPDVLDADGRPVQDAVALARAWVELALAEALAGVDLDAVPPGRRALFVGAEAARPDIQVMARALLDHTSPSRDDAEGHAPWSLTRWLAARLDVRGPVATLSTACTSSAQAVGEALLCLRRGEADLAIVAGADVLVHPLMLTGFARLGALSTRNDAPEAASRPFDLDRDGFVLGEGAGVMVLARPDPAHRLGSRLGVLRGYGGSSSAWRITDSPPDGRGAASSMAAALLDAGCPAEQVACINAHGTSTRQNDASEARGVRTVLGSHADVAWVSSTKGAMGHLVAACGVVEACLALQAVRDGVAPATHNLERVDPDCDVRHVLREPVPLSGRVALSNAFGFGGVNATLVLEAP